MEAIERVLDVNLMGVRRTDRAVLPQITERKGYLLNIASLAAVAHAPMMAPYATAKAGVEALSDCLRQETAPTGASVGCAYFGFIDTDLVRAGFEEPSAQAMRQEMPGFLTKTQPLSKAVDAIEDGVERRAARVWAPRFVGAAPALRGILQPLTERRATKSSHLPEALRLADPEQGGGERDDPVLGARRPAGSAQPSSCWNAHAPRHSIAPPPGTRAASSAPPAVTGNRRGSHPSPAGRARSPGSRRCALSITPRSGRQ